MRIIRSLAWVIFIVGFQTFGTLMFLSSSFCLSSSVMLDMSHSRLHFQGLRLHRTAVAGAELAMTPAGQSVGITGMSDPSSMTEKAFESSIVMRWFEEGGGGNGQQCTWPRAHTPPFHVVTERYKVVDDMRTQCAGG